MPIDRDDRDERQARLDWMIDEFQDARRRWLVTRTHRAVKVRLDAETHVTVEGQSPQKAARLLRPVPA